MSDEAETVRRCLVDSEADSEIVTLIDVGECEGLALGSVLEWTGDRPGSVLTKFRCRRCGATWLDRRDLQPGDFA